MTKEASTHVGFSDETRWNTGRFRALALVTMEETKRERVNSNLLAILQESGVKEFKWKNCDGARERFAAEKMLAYALQEAILGTLRIDVLIWDIEDSRHKIRGRDDIANLQRMYYHLLKQVLTKRWPERSKWLLIPDENTAIDWDNVEDFVDRAGFIVKIWKDLFTGGKFKLRMIREFKIDDIVPCHSSQEPISQLADLFAGLGVYSRDNYDRYDAWLEQNDTQRSLLGNIKKVSRSFSLSEKERFPLIKQFNDRCKKNKMYVSLRKNRGFMTMKPSMPVNFWLYEAQREEDKAPIKNPN